MITLHNDHLTVEIATLGAEMQRVCDASGYERLWNGDPAFWTGRAPVLFPVAGAFKDDTYMLRGKRYTMPKHGFARKREFAVEAQDETSATLVLARAAGEEPGFPFAFTFRVRFTLMGNAIEVQYITENTGNEAFWFGVGAHEAYACPEGIESYRIVFDEPEKLFHNVLDGSVMTGETALVQPESDTLTLSHALFTNDCLVLQGLASRGVRLESTLHDRTVRVDYASLDTLLLWTKPGAPYICIEPWTNPPDFIGTDYDITKKPGMVGLEPGARDTRTHTITFD